MPAPHQQPSAQKPVDRTSQADDIVLVRNAQKGDNKAFDVLVEKHHDRLYRFICQRFRDKVEAWDITQTTFMKAYEGLGKFRGESIFYTWLCTIAYHEAVDELRRQGRLKNVVSLDSTDKDGNPIPPPPDPSSPQEERVMAKEEGEALPGKIREGKNLMNQRLSPLEREIFRLHFCGALPGTNELSWRKVAQKLNKVNWAVQENGGEDFKHGMLANRWGRDIRNKISRILQELKWGAD